MAIEVIARCADEAAAWAALDEMRARDPWCLAVEGATARALFPRDPSDLPGERAPPRADRFGSGWREELRATQVGPLWILYPERRPPAGAQRPVFIDAMSAFGAGTHPTTWMCLERVVERSPVEAVLDVGTGSGVLAIAALVLGAQRARGIDVEPKALASAHANAARNRVTLELDAGPIAERWPLVLANVRTPALIELAPALIAASTEELVLSGVREEELDALLEAYARLGVSPSHVERRDGWARVDIARV